MARAAPSWMRTQAYVSAKTNHESLELDGQRAEVKWTQCKGGTESETHGK